MAQVTVDVSDKVVDTAVKKEIKRLKLQIQRIKSNNDKLKEQIRAQKFKIDEANRIVCIASNIAAEFGDEWGE